MLYYNWKTSIQFAYLQTNVILYADKCNTVFDPSISHWSHSNNQWHERFIFCTLVFPFWVLGSRIIASDQRNYSFWSTECFLVTVEMGFLRSQVSRSSQVNTQIIWKVCINYGQIHLIRATCDKSSKWIIQYSHHPHKIFISNKLKTTVFMSPNSYSEKI